MHRLVLMLTAERILVLCKGGADLDGVGRACRLEAAHAWRETTQFPFGKRPGMIE